MSAEEKLIRILKAIRKQTDFMPKIAIVLGSGLGNYGELIEKKEIIEYSRIKGFPVSTVVGHQGRYIFGYIEGVPVVAMQGRVHYYEGYSMDEVVMPIRLMGLLGAKVLILTNAAGGMNFSFEPGDLMLIRDHISTFVPSPLIGANLESLGTRFPDMSSIYDPSLCAFIKEVAEQNNIFLKEGIYVQLTGPQYETPTEIRMLRAMGADAVGMSTAVEAIAARHMGMRVCGISCISNLASGMSEIPLSHAEVQETADRVAKKFECLITQSIARIGESLPKTEG